MGIRRIILAVLLIVLAVTAGVLSMPLHRPSELVRSWLLKQAPLGSSFGDVQALVARHQWASQDGWGGESFRKVKGDHWLQTELGDYRGFPIPFACHARAMWGFEHEKLLDIRVDKSCDTL